MDGNLFDKGQASPGEVAAKLQPAAGSGKARLRVPQRDQVELHWASLDELLDAEHPARAVWAAVCGLDLSGWLAEIKAVEGHVGRDATDPRLLLALWVYATLDAVGSARELERLCEKHLVYQWLCGGVTVNHHLLSDFRSQGAGHWDGVLTNLVGTLMAENLVTMKRVAQDGMRVWANAGKGTFRRRARLEGFLEEARQQVETLRQQSDEDNSRQQAARQRAVRERQERIEAAIRQCDQLQQQREVQGRRSGRAVKEARASTTDADATTMKLAHGGFQPGYNVQYATDTQSGVIVGVEVTSVGSDHGLLPPMLEQLKERYGRVPEEAVVDGGFASHQTIEEAAAQGCTVYAPLKDEQKILKAGQNPFAKKLGDSAAVGAWRQRMGTEAAKAIYGLRCQTAEWVNALCRNRGLRQMPVRGLPKCRTIAVLYAIAHNMVRGMRLRAKANLTEG